MTTMGIQNNDFDNSQFNFLKHQSKRALYGVQSKPRGQASRGSNTNKTSHTISANTNQTRKYAKNGQSSTALKNNYAKEERFYQESYSKMGSKSYKAQKMVYASTASDSDSNNANTQSDLYGFKIVQNARIIHDEVEEDLDLFESDNEWPMSSTNTEKFAASVLTIGPNAKEISLPSFA